LTEAGGAGTKGAMTAAPIAPGISRFGQTLAGSHVEAIVLRGGGLTARLLTRGVTLQGLWRDGTAHSLTPGLPDIAGYEAATSYLGALVGPVANRIGGAAAVLDGQTHRFPANEGGVTTLHSGDGIHARIWRLDELGESSATFSLDLAHGNGGFPGNRRLTARYALPGNSDMRLDLTASTDRPTWINLAQHSYWNLDGTAQWRGHRLRVAADHWLPVDALGIPTGEIRPAAAEMDLRTPRDLVPGAPALDHTFCLAPARRALTEVAELTGFSGLRMRLATTEPGLQVYDGRAPIRPGGGAYEGLALEPQGWPDAPNRPGFPSVVLRPGATYHQTSVWTFDH
jgi:aldose 1-epimerase